MIWLYLVFSYLLGCLMFGFLVTKVLYHQDLRVLGSRNVGARNAGRLHGKKSFLIIFAGDALKGAAVIAIGRYLQFSEPIQLLGLGLAIIGHLKPITLKFKGGKGISTFIGGIVSFDPMVAAVVIPTFLIFYPFTRSFTLSGLGSFLSIPIFLVFKSNNWTNPAIVFAILVLIFLAHSVNIKQRLSNPKRKK